MANMINFGIDLGTTNSLIAKFNKGEVIVFKNPSDQGVETLPSVVGFRNDRTLVGKRAKTYWEKDPKNVVARFKRKMGTTEAFHIKALGKSKTPTELSAEVLKELKTFIQTGEIPETIVITIPACFNMAQANATKEAGHLAGFKHVILLNEPIAASLAYANKERNIDLRNSQWIVYDLGGGTFDVALVKIVAGDLKVVDHEGDNNLGGSDFDALIVEKLIVPQLETKGKFSNLLRELKADSGRYNALWYVLLHKAEEAKIELSSHTSADIDFTIEDETGKEVEVSIAITRSEYEELIKKDIDSTAEMLKTILTRNSLRPQDLKFVLMVGGVTYTPFVRKRVEELLGIPVNCGIDPTNAIVVGAAYFAATKEIGVPETVESKPAGPKAIRIRVACNPASQEKEEPFSARVEGDTNGLFYRIQREDGGFDTGRKKLEARIFEDLPLQEDAFNIFSFGVFDATNNPIATGVTTIQIAQGKYSVVGQTLPHDLCLVNDDPNTGGNKLEPLFRRLSVLPAKTRKSVEVSKTIVKGSTDVIRIWVVEGPAETDASANQTVGILEISGKQITRDVHKGMSIDLIFDLSESRDLKIAAHVEATAQDFSGLYTSKDRDVPVRALQADIQALDKRIESEIEEAEANKNQEVVGELEALRSVAQELQGGAMLLDIEDSTQARYKLDDRKRKVAQQVFALTAGKHLDRLKGTYQELKRDTLQLVNEHGNDNERHQLNELFALEHTFTTSSNRQKIADAISRLRRISFQVLRRTPDFLTGWFEHLLTKRSTFNDQVQAKSLIEAGKRHIASQDYDHLAEVNMRLNDLLPQSEQVSAEKLASITNIIIN